MSAINESFKLPCGVSLQNRMAKAALTERLTGPDFLPNGKHVQLYKTWASGGAGMLLSGNILIDRRYLESSGNVVVEGNTSKAPFKKWTKTVTDTNTHFWAQINHAGRQSNIFSTWQPVAPSAVKLKKMGLFGKPRALTESEIIDIKERFVQTAAFCQKVGFTGIQFHAAHGYLLSQFLSPKINKRTDRWGGSIDNRARLLLEIVEQTRKVVGTNFPISVKLNSADFQRGGFDETDALYVIKELGERGIDLLEISGGTYEEVTFFTKKGIKQSTIEREAYFLDFAKEVRRQSKVPIMVTGGFRTLVFCNKVLANKELDVVGFGRPFLIHDNFAKEFLEGTLEKVEDPDIKMPIKAYFDAAVAGYYDYQIAQIAAGRKIDLTYKGWQAVLRFTKNEMVQGIRNRQSK